MPSGQETKRAYSTPPKKCDKTKQHMTTVDVDESKMKWIQYLEIRVSKYLITQVINL